MAIRLTGPLDVEALHQGLQTIVDRHEAVRTTFALVDGQPVQIIKPLHLPLQIVDIQSHPIQERESMMLQLAKEDLQRVFNLADGPIIHATLLRMTPDDHVLVLNLHHIASDAWSIGVFTRELSACYTAITAGVPISLPPLPIQYADYAVWQRAGLH